MEHHLSIEESIRFGWQKMRVHSKLVFQILLTLFALQIAGQMVTQVLGGTLEGAVASVVLVVLSILVGIGYTLVTLHLAEGKHASYEDIIPSFKISLAYVGANILSAIVMLVPLLAALVVYAVAFVTLPTTAATVLSAVVIAVAAVMTVNLMLRYAFVRFAILEDTDMIQSLRTSAQMTEGHKWWLVGFLIVLVLLNLLGVLLFLVGLLVSVPVSMFALAHVYVKLRGHHH